MEKQLMVVKPGTLSSKDKEKLTKAGKLVIEHPDPHSGIAFKSFEQNNNPYVYDLCNTCGSRIYMTQEQMSTLKKFKTRHFCLFGHGQNYS